MIPRNAHLNRLNFIVSKSYLKKSNLKKKKKWGPIKFLKKMKRTRPHCNV